MKNYSYLVALLVMLVSTQVNATSSQAEQIKALQQQVKILTEQIQAVQTQLSRLEVGRRKDEISYQENRVKPSHEASGSEGLHIGRASIETTRSDEGGANGSSNHIYVGGGLGWAAHNISGSKIDSQYIEHGRPSLGNTEVSNWDKSFKLFVGYRINRFIAAELGYADLGTYRVKSILRSPFLPWSGEQGVKASIKPYAAFLDVVGYLPVKGKLTLVGRVGAYRGVNNISAKEYDTSVMGVLRLRRDSVRDVGYGVKYGAGFQYDVDDDFAIRAEWERYLLGYKVDSMHINTWMLSGAIKF
jgi:hypothetical protein